MTPLAAYLTGVVVGALLLAWVLAGRRRARADWPAECYPSLTGD